jgi:hypothetical protein
MDALETECREVSQQLCLMFVLLIPCWLLVHCCSYSNIL